MRDILRLRFERDTDGTGELFVEVRCKGFTGASSAWFGDNRLIEFAQRLAATYPLQADSRVELEGGFWDKSGKAIEELHVGVSFYPVGSVGRIGCRIILNTPIHEPARRESQLSVAVELHTTYEQLSAFARSLEQLANGGIDEAVLEETAG